MDVYGIKYNCFNKLGIRITINELNHPQSLLVLLRVALYICSQKGLPVEFVVEQRTMKGRTITNKENSGSLTPGGEVVLPYLQGRVPLDRVWILGTRPSIGILSGFQRHSYSQHGTSTLTCLVNILPYSVELGSRIVRLG